jgi:hypothetical protein
MKRNLLTLSFLTFISVGFANAQFLSWKWAKSAAGKAYDQCSAVAADEFGNIIVAGYFASDSLVVGNTILHNSGLGFDEIFIAKYDSTGNLDWAKGIGGSDDDKATALATDRQGNIYMVGYFYSPSITFGSFTLTNGGSGDIFIVKFDMFGNALWAKREGGPSLEIPYSISLDGSGNMIIGGRFSSNSVTFGNTTLHQAGSMDIFLVKYSSTGEVVWAKGIGGGSNDEAYAVHADANGYILLSGYFNQTVSFGETSLTSAGLADVFLARYDSSGNVLWAGKAGGNADDRATAVSSDEPGNAYVVGYFKSPSIQFGEIVLQNTGGENSFIVKYGASGQVVWAHLVNGDSRALSVAVLNKQVYTCGEFSEDSLDYGSSTLYIEGNRDLYVVNCDTDGLKKGAIKQSSGGESSEFAYVITARAGGNVWIAGMFDSDPISFGSTVLHNTSNGFDMFIAKLGFTVIGLQDAHNDIEMEVFPNPTNGKFRLKSGLLNAYIEIYNGNGERIIMQQKDALTDDVGLDISSFASGIYYIRLVTLNHSYSRKIVLIEN